MSKFDDLKMSWGGGSCLCCGKIPCISDWPDEERLGLIRDSVSKLLARMITEDRDSEDYGGLSYDEMVQELCCLNVLTGGQWQ